jgi:hypothetical protein
MLIYFLNVEQQRTADASHRAEPDAMGSRRGSDADTDAAGARPPPMPTILISPGDYERVSEIAKGVRATALKQCLPIGLVLAITVGLAAPMLGIAVASARVLGFGVVDTLCVWLIFFVSGLTLKTEEAKEAIGCVWPTHRIYQPACA